VTHTSDASPLQRLPRALRVIVLTAMILTMTVGGMTIIGIALPQKAIALLAGGFLVIVILWEVFSVQSPRT
jgi:hypothetical protein